MKYNLLKPAILRKISTKAVCQAAILLLCTSIGFASTAGSRPADFKAISTNDLPAAVVVKGKVTDEKGEPLPGVSIRIKGTSAGATTDASGKYQVTVPDANAVLVFTFIGFQPQERSVGGQAVINVTLQPVDKNLDEVVVVGYGVQKKANISGAVSTVSGTQLNKRVVTSPLSLLQGQAPGLTVIENSGEPGNEGIQIRIRGIATFQANADPLVVVDGIPMAGVGNINQLNPNDIDNISVLKDAASASIYGTRAANGVILVTTKKGSANGKFNLDYTYNAGITSASRLLHLVTNSVEYMTLYNQAQVRSFGSGVAQYSAATIAQYSPGGIYANINTDWQDLIFSTVVTSNHYLSASGTTNNTKYNVSFGYIDQPGIMVGTAFKKYTFQLGLNTTINKTIDMGVNVNMNYTDRRTPAQGTADTYLSAVTQPPIFGPYVLNGNGDYTDTNASDPLNIFHNKNVFASAALAQYIQKGYNGILNSFINVKIAKGLVWETRGGLNFQYVNTNQFRPLVHTYNYYTDKVGSNLDVGGNAGNISVTETTNINPVIYSQLHYDKSIGAHNFQLLGGVQDDYNYADNLTAFRYGILPYVTNLRQVNVGSAATATNGSSSTITALQSLYGRFNYNFKQKYFLEANGRYDGSSRFAPGRQWAFFPSVSAAWRATEETFVKNLDLKWLSEFKFRGSWGRLGNQNFNVNGGPYLYQPVLSTNALYPIDNGSSASIAVTNGQLIDDTIRWETSESTDLAVDASFFSGKLSFSADWYNRRTYDIVRQPPITAYKGLSAPVVNLGIMRNRGWEFTTGYNDRKGNFLYGVTANLTMNRNVVIKYGGTQINSTTIAQDGHEFNSYYLYDWIGIFQSQAEIDASPKQSFSPKPGDLKYRDVNGDGVIDSKDRTYFTGQYPLANYGFSLNFGYKAFDLTAFFYGVYGYKNYVNGFGAEPFIQGEPPLTSFRNAWTPDNHSNTIPALYAYGYNPVDNLPSTYFLKDASFLRIKNLQLGYNVPALLSKKLGMTSLRFYVATDNLAVISKYAEGDPERTGGGQADVYPQNRIIEIGAKVKF